MSDAELGADFHDWESEYAALEDDLRTEPVEALPEFMDLVERMLEAAGYALGPDGEYDEPEVEKAIERARELVDLRERGEDVPVDDAFQAAAELRELYRGLLEHPEAETGADLRSAGHPPEPSDIPESTD
jgi:hypothetical protein